MPISLSSSDEFGLILFVYAMGLQIGPGLTSSLRRDGLPLNMMAATIVLLGGALCVALHHFAGIDAAVVVGIFSGATTDTPSLGAARGAAEFGRHGPRGAETSRLGIRRVLSVRHSRHYHYDDPSARDVPGKYSFGSRGFFRLSEVAGRDPSCEEFSGEESVIERNDDWKSEAIRASGAVISRVLHGAAVGVADRDTVLQEGDIVVAVGNPRALKHFSEVVGPESEVDVRTVTGRVTTRRLIVTNKGVVGSSIEELDVADRFSVVITRVRRADAEFSVRPAPAPSVR